MHPPAALLTFKRSGLGHRCGTRLEAVSTSCKDISQKDCSLAVNYRALSANLSRFYDFTDKVVLYVGAGGRQLLDPSITIRKLIAIDQDPKSLTELERSVALKGLKDSVEIVGSAFEDVELPGMWFTSNSVCTRQRILPRHFHTPPRWRL